ncbi:MAG: glycoside hydrolase family 15 protein [Chthoniobacterales bacterium]
MSERRARAQYDRGRATRLRNDLGLLSEEYNPVAKRQVGNSPQAFSHVALVNSAQMLGGSATDNCPRNQQHSPRKRAKA